MPAVSVVIPTRNRAASLREAIASVMAQTHTDWEVIVIDDGSTDETPDLLRALTARDSRIRALPGPGLGAGAARNTGIRAAGGTFVAFLDDDDVWEPAKLQRQLDALARHPEAGLVFTDAVVFDDRGVVKPSVLPKRSERFAAWIASCRQGASDVSHGWLQPVLWFVNPVTLSTVLLRRTALDASGLFRETREAGEGYDLWLRMARQTTMILLDAPLVRYRITAAGYMGAFDARAYRTREFDATVLETHLADVPGDLRARVRERIADGFKMAGWYWLREGRRPEARALLVKSLKHRWLQPKVLAYLALACLPVRVLKPSGVS